MKRIDQAALLLASIGSAVSWVWPHFVEPYGLPEWLVSRFYLLICAPAVVCGCRYWRRYGGFAKSRLLLACMLLGFVALAWTDETELGRGLLLAAGFAVTLPIAALLRKRAYAHSFMRAFGFATIATIIYGFLYPGVSGSFAILSDFSETSVSNRNDVAFQAGIAILFFLSAVPQKSRAGKIVSAALVGLPAFALILTESRTAFVALAAAGVAWLWMRGRRNARELILGTGAFVALLVAVLLVAPLAQERPFYDGITSRLVYDDEGTVATLGDRTPIWEFAAHEFIQGTTWIYGVGTGGVDKDLGQMSLFNGRARGRDGIWRLHSHNTIIWCALAFGGVGLLLFGWLEVQLVARAWRLDLSEQSCTRSSILLFISTTSIAAVVLQQPCWVAVGACLWALVSDENGRHAEASNLRQAAARYAHRPISVRAGGAIVTAGHSANARGDPALGTYAR